MGEFSVLIENEQKNSYFLSVIVSNWQTSIGKLAMFAKRRSYSFQVMPIHKTDEGQENFEPVN